MKFLIVGLGSMGKRRARLLQRLRPQAQLLGVDSSADRRAEAAALGLSVWESLPQALAEGVQAAFVCTPPATHAPLLEELLQRGVPCFSELNLVDDGYDRLQALAEQKAVPLFLSSTMLYRGETRCIRDAVHAYGRPVQYLYHIGQYLPDWHPWEDYRHFFAGSARTNGCREIFGIELPWLLQTFGAAEVVSVQHRRLTTLQIAYPDSWLVQLDHADGSGGVLAVDVASPKAVRRFECFAEGLQLFWEGTPQTLYRYDPTAAQNVPISVYDAVEHDSRYSDNIVENAYVDEIAEFLQLLEQGTPARYSFVADRQCIALMDAIGV